MKVQFGKERRIGRVSSSERGFSTLEIMIAMVILTLALTGALTSNVAAQYWSITAETSNEALYKAKTTLENVRAIARGNFYKAVSKPLSVDTDTVCAAGGLCYFVGTTVFDVSSCSKYVEASVEWQVVGYPTSTTSLFTHLTNPEEAIARGGDCLVETPDGNWAEGPSQGSLSFTPGKMFTGVDALHGKIYTTSATSPYISIYAAPSAEGNNPTALGSTNGANFKLNSLDVVDDLGTGRTYAFVAQAATTSQLALFDVTDSSNPSLVIEKRIAGTNPPLGPTAEGWRVVVYDGRLYITTPETTGNEFFIFDVTTATQPTQIGNGFSLNRTVNDFVIRDQKISGSVRRLAFLATDSDSEELVVLDVTGDAISSVGTYDLSGSRDALSIAVLGNHLYLGRAVGASGPELYGFDITDPINATVMNQGEVSADVISISASSEYAFLGTRKSGEEFQVWNADPSTWNPAVTNAGRLESTSVPNLAPRGIDLEKWVYVISQSVGSDALRTFFGI